MDVVHNTNHLSPVINLITPEVSTPTISSSAMLAEVNISQWIGRKQDKEVANEVDVAKQTKTRAGSYSKKLLPDEPVFETIGSIVSEARLYHKHTTMPWSNSGLRLLTTKMFFDYQKKMTEYEDKFNRAVDAFIAEYHAMVARAPAKLNELFKFEDYPNEDDLRGKFRFSIKFAPVPEAGDFRVDVGNEALAQLKESYVAMYKEQIEDAYKDVWQRLYEPLKHMSTKLEGNEKQTFRDTLVTNVQDIVSLLDKFNITDDPMLRKAKLKIEHTLMGITPDALREDDHLRLDTKRKVDELLKEFSW